MSDINRQELIKLLQGYVGWPPHHVSCMGFPEMYQKLADEILKLQSKEKDIPKREWEIESYIDPTVITDIPLENVIWKCSNVAFYRAQVYQYPIHSVKRLSDNVVFTLGDGFELKHFKVHPFKITDFYTAGKDMFINNGKGGWNIMNIEKVKPKEALFTTSDGVEIFENDSFWQITEDFILVYIYRVQKFWDNNYFKTFSTLEKAKVYVFQHKPMPVTWRELTDNFIVNGKPNGKYRFLSDFFEDKITP